MNKRKYVAESTTKNNLDWSKKRIRSALKYVRWPERNVPTCYTAQLCLHWPSSCQPKRKLTLAWATLFANKLNITKTKLRMTIDWELSQFNCQSNVVECCCCRCCWLRRQRNWLLCAETMFRNKIETMQREQCWTLQLNTMFRRCSNKRMNCF